MTDASISDRDWFGVREAARSGHWLAVLRFAERRGWATMVRHARVLVLAESSDDERDLAMWVIARALLLDRPDEPDPFADHA